MPKAFDDEEDTFEAITLAAATEAFEEYEARERAARAVTAKPIAAEQPRPLPTRSAALHRAPTRKVEPTKPDPHGPTERIDVSFLSPKVVSGWLAYAKNADYFATLGLTRDADDAAVLEAKNLALSALASAPADLRDRARALIEEAASVLGDQATRAAYARHLSMDDPPTVNPDIIFWLPGSRRRT